MFVLENETPEKWTRLLETWTKKLQPRDDAEMQIVTEAAFARWRLQRVWTIETALFDLEMDSQAPALAEKFEVIDEGIRQASAFKALADESLSLELIHRYETRYSRSFQRALATLEALRKLDPEAQEDEAKPIPQLVATKVPAPSPKPQQEFLPNESPASIRLTNPHVVATLKTESNSVPR
jgi:hypothetical protein